MNTHGVNENMKKENKEVYKKSQWLIGKWKKITAHLSYTY